MKAIGNGYTITYEDLGGNKHKVRVKDKTELLESIEEITGYSEKISIKRNVRFVIE